MSFNLRKRTLISYHEPEEPSFDEYLYCERCADFVYDYCSIHGPLLVVPDNKVPVKTNIPTCVPRAALTIPYVFLHLAPSIIPGAGLGVFSTLTLPRGVRFGPYRGQRTQAVDSAYCWQIYDSNKKLSHVVDAADGDRSNWMRFVNCARHWKEQNLLAYQYRGQMYYRTIKTIPRHTELMVFYGSEFANSLHINLRQYNSANYYKEIICPATKHPPQNKYDDCMQEEYFNADQFHFIDEYLDDNDKNKNCSLRITIDDTSQGLTRTENDTPQQCKENILKPRHVCETCHKTFSNTRNLKEHVLKHLNIWKFNCDYCSYKSNHGYRFKLHVGKHTNTYRFSCKTCSYGTNYRRNFIRHCFRHETDKSEFQNLLRNKNHFLSPKPCEICDFKTLSRRSFSTHMSKHKGNIYKCNSCTYSSYRKYNLYRHIARMGH